MTISSRLSEDWHEAESEWSGDGYLGGGWSALIKSWGHEVLVECWTGYYQGDIFVIVKDGDRYGFVAVGYGSCSGCDALVDATLDEAIELSRRLESGIRWGTAQEIADYLTSDDTLLEWYGWVDDFKDEFLPEALGVLGAVAA